MSDKYQDKTLEMFQLMDKGLSVEQARTLVKPDMKVSKQADYKLEQKYKQYALTHPNRVRKASKLYDNILSGKPTMKDGDKPNINQQLTVAKEILDRAYPKITRNENLNINANLDVVDLEKYRR